MYTGKIVKRTLCILSVMILMISFALTPSYAVATTEMSFVQKNQNYAEINIGNGKHLRITPNTEVSTSSAQNVVSSVIDDVETKILPSGAYETTCTVTAYTKKSTGGISLFSSQDSGKSEGGITSTLKMTYFLRNNNSDIKITNVSGGWSAQYASAPITVQKQSVFATNGTLYFPDNLYRYPDLRTFSYNTGWDYVQVYPQMAELGTGARAYSECQYIISSMGLNWVTFGTWLHLDLV